MAFEYQPTLPPPAPHVAATGPAGFQDWTVSDCLRALQRRKLTLAYITAVCTLVAGIVCLFQPRMYQSVASIEVQRINENFLNAGDIFPATALSSTDGTAYVQTQAEILQQDALMEQVVQKLHLQDRPEYQIDSGSHGADSGNTNSIPEIWNAVSVLKKHLKVVPLRGSHIIQIVCEARDSQLAAEIANSLAQISIDANVESRRWAAQQTYEALNGQLAALSRRLLDSESRLAESERFGVGLNAALQRTSLEALKSEVDLNRRSYESMSKRIDDARVAAAVRQADLRSVGPAQPAQHPYKPNVPFNLALGVLGGLILAVGSVMLQDQSSPTVRLPGEASISLALPELGVIPHFKKPSFLGFGLNRRGHQKGQAERIPWDEFSQMAESFRATLASILFPSHCTDHPRSLIVTSSWPMEGKTTIVSNLGVRLTEIGRKVLLIDGDMRRPRLHQVFDQANSWGLSDILREQDSIEDLPLDVLVTKTAVPGLFLLPSGASAVNVTALLWSSRMARLLPRFHEVFDYVLLDAPPCLEFADARIMARYADQLVLVVRANYTDRRAAQAAVRRLLLDEIHVRGVILNCCDPARGGFYRYADYGFLQ